MNVDAESGFSRTVVSAIMKTREPHPEREEAISLGILPEENVSHWTEIEEGRYQPRRTRGAFAVGNSLERSSCRPGMGDKQPA
jgi:hypothetical protein